MRDFSDVFLASLFIYSIVLILGIYIRHKQNQRFGKNHNHHTKISQLYVQVVASSCAILTFTITYKYY